MDSFAGLQRLLLARRLKGDSHLLSVGQARLGVQLDRLAVNHTFENVFFFCVIFCLAYRTDSLRGVRLAGCWPVREMERLNTVNIKDESTMLKVKPAELSGPVGSRRSTTTTPRTPRGHRRRGGEEVLAGGLPDARFGVEVGSQSEGLPEAERGGAIVALVHVAPGLNRRQSANLSYTIHPSSRRLHPLSC